VSTSLFACRNPLGPQWQLGPLPPARGRVALIGWSEEPPRQDGGVPQHLARVLARAFTSIARATFPSSAILASASDVWSAANGDGVRRLAVKSVRGRIAARLRGAPPEMMLVSTRQPQSLMRVFDDEGFPWWMQGQVILLSRPDAPPPAVDERVLLASFDDDWTMNVAALGPSVDAVVRPGVDGDVAGLWSLAETFEQTVLVALENEARAAGFSWAIVSEEEFAAKASGEKHSLG
jgi:hypothetical protein